VQVVEYLRAFLFGRLGWNRLGGSLVISGAFGLFRKEYLHAIGGYRATSVVEDLDLVVRLHRYLRQHKRRYEIPFIRTRSRGPRSPNPGGSCRASGSAGTAA